MSWPHLSEWLALTLRWFHLVTGAAWIGASFYFIWLNNHVRPLEVADPDPAVKAEVHAIHGGAFYRVSKYGGAPGQLPKVLHWFKWEAYLTWTTGFFLLALTYWHDAKAMMVGGTAGLGVGGSVGVGVGSLVLGWVVYDLACRWLAGRPMVLAIGGFLAFTAASYGLFQLLSPRGATMHLGAMIGTIMAANVLFVIIPGQRAMVDAMVAGLPPPLERGAAGSLRSLHNNYLTLPALFVMVSNHYPVVWGHPLGWLLVVGVCVLGGLIRHGFNLAGQGKPRPWTPSLLGAVGLVLLALATSRAEPKPSGAATVNFTEVQIIMANRCLSCHAQVPVQPGFIEAPKGLVLEDRASIEANRQKIGSQVASLVMPLGNLTAMTDEERAKVVAWATAQ